MTPLLLSPTPWSLQIPTHYTSAHPETWRFRPTFLQTIRCKHRASHAVRVPLPPAARFHLIAPHHACVCFLILQELCLRRGVLLGGKGPIPEMPYGAFYSWKNRLTPPNPTPALVMENIAHKSKRVENLKHLAKRHANSIISSFLPPFHEIQHLYFSSSKKIAEQDLSLENYGPAYYKTDVLRWHSAFPLTPAPCHCSLLLPSR